MSWISDISYELESLNLSISQLRKFGLTIGFILMLIGSYFLFSINISTISFALILIGIVLIFLGFIFPQKLKIVYKYWMTLAFTLGWFVSRIILTLLFIFVITPISIIAKLLNKKFLDLNFKNKKTSYWINKNNKHGNLEKMY